jgi:hypothetical protein
MRVIDDAMPDFADLQAAIMAPGFPWYYARGTREDDGNANPYLYGWAHMVFDKGAWYSEQAGFITHKVAGLLQALKESVNSLLRLRIVMNTISDQPYLNGPHVDFVYPHKTALLYINDADGDTVVYNEQWNDGIPDPLTVARTVAPAAGRAFLFDGLQLHTGTTPTKAARRIVLNINYD